MLILMQSGIGMRMGIATVLGLMQRPSLKKLVSQQKYPTMLHLRQRVLLRQLKRNRRREQSLHQSPINLLTGWPAMMLWQWPRHLQRQHCRLIHKSGAPVPPSAIRTAVQQFITVTGAESTMKPWRSSAFVKGTTSSGQAVLRPGRVRRVR